jgi:hypothetical protein
MREARLQRLCNEAMKVSAEATGTLRMVSAITIA